VLSEVEVLSVRGSILTMPLGAITDGIVIAEIEGLDPVKATIVTTSSANQDGTQYHTSIRDDRNIKLKLEMLPDEVTQTVSSIRSKLYEFFMPKAPVKFTFRTEEGVDVDIVGRVESFENAHFTQEPTVDISIICFDPDFVDPDVITVPGSTVSTATTFEIDYDGTVETSVIFTLTLDRDLSEFTIYSTMPDGSVRNLDFALAMLDGDTLVINTQPGNKSVTQYRGPSIFAYPLYAVSPQSSWIEIQPGINVFRVYAAGAAIPFTLDYQNRYGGL
jgi:hypothetical protein